MQRYWDLPERDRGDLQHNQLEAFYPIELMEKGVVKPSPPEILPDIELPPYDLDGLLTVRIGYSRTYVAFATAGDLDRFLKTALHLSSPDDMHEAQPFDGAEDVTVERVSAYKTETARVLRSQIQHRQERVRKNADDRRRFEIAERETDEILSNIRADWQGCRDKKLPYRKVVQTFDEYRKLAEDSRVALKFLLNAFSPHEVVEAFEWLGYPTPPVGQIDDPLLCEQFAILLDGRRGNDTTRKEKAE